MNVPHGQPEKTAKIKNEKAESDPASSINFINDETLKNAALSVYVVFALSGLVSDSRRTIYQLYISHRRFITATQSALQYTNVTAWAAFIAWTQISKQFAHGRFVTQTIKCKASISNAVLLCKSNQRFGNCAQLFSFGDRSFDNLVLNQRHSHIAKHCFTMSTVAVKLTPTQTMTHIF